MTTGQTVAPSWRARVRAGARAATCALGLALLTGCASLAPPAAGTDRPAKAAAPVDPWEGFNRKVFAFNETLDEALIRPVAQSYKEVVPQFVRTGVANFFGNLGDVWSTANQFLQAKPQQGLEMGMRVLTNTFFGFAGVLDIATDLGLTRQSEDFGQTLGRWGLPAGPYVVLPLFGPSSVRDTGGLVVDRRASVRPAENEDIYVGMTILQIVSLRASLLAATGLLNEVALDKYSFVRDAYLARRLDQVYDGAPPMPDFGDEEDSKPAEPKARR